MKVIKGSGVKLQIQSKYSPALLRACKTTPGMQWSSALRMWEGYSDAVECVVAKLEAEGIRVERI